MGTKHFVDDPEKYQRWVWRIHPECRECRAQRLTSNLDSAWCKWKVPIGLGQKCLFMKPREVKRIEGQL